MTMSGYDSRQRSVNPQDLGLTKNPPTSVRSQGGTRRRSRSSMPTAPISRVGEDPSTPTADAANYDWPENEHGITVDYKGNVWICGYGKNDEAKKDDNSCSSSSPRTEASCCRFRASVTQSKGSLDTENLNHATKVVVWPKTNEAFISDGYVNRRVIVVDADTGRFKRMWGGVRQQAR